MMVSVNLSTNSGNELDDGLCVVVSWSSFTTNHNNSWGKLVLSLVLGGVEDGKISVDDGENVHKLSLILMYSLNLNIVHGIEWDVITGSFLDPSLELHLVISLNVNKLLHERSVGGVWGDVVQVVEAGDPLIDSSEGIAEKLGESWVTAMDPSSWGDTVGLVLELAWVEFMELLEDSLLQELGVESGNTVDGVGADDGKVGHSDFLWVSLLNDGHSLDLLVIIWELLLELGDIDMVDQIDELQMSWEESSDEVGGPLLEGFWEHGMVGVREGVVNNVPGLLEAKLLLIDEDSKKLDGSDSWMSIVKLDLVEIREPGEVISMLVLVSSNDIIHGGRAEEVLLLKSELLTGIGGVVGVEDGGNVLGVLSILDGSVIVGRVELVEIEGVSWSGSPQSQSVCVIGVETWDGVIVGHGDDLLAALPVGSLGTAIHVFLGVSVESNIIDDILSLNLPRVTLVEPEIWDLTLISILDDLLEDTVVVSNTISDSWDLEGGERVKETSGKSSKTTVSKSGISLLLIELLKLVADVHEGLLEWVLKVRVDESILEGSSHEELK